jgi:hypothetical protein
MIRCELTGISYDDKYLTKTLDGHDISFNIWKAITFDAKKGLLTYEECEHYYKINLEYLNTLAVYLKRVINEADNSYNKSKKVLKEYLKVENSYFETYYKKAIGCTTKLEKIDYFNKVINNTDRSKPSKPLTNGNVLIDVTELYNKYNTQLTIY